MTTKAEQLRHERLGIVTAKRYDMNWRIAEIDKELKALKRRSNASKAYRETMYDLNGHHGKA